MNECGRIAVPKRAMLNVQRDAIILSAGAGMHAAYHSCCCGLCCRTVHSATPMLNSSSKPAMMRRTHFAPDAPHDVDDQRRGVEQDQEVAGVVREPAHRRGQQRLPHRHLWSANNVPYRRVLDAILQAAVDGMPHCHVPRTCATSRSSLRRLAILSASGCTALRYILQQPAIRHWLVWP